MSLLILGLVCFSGSTSSRRFAQPRAAVIGRLGEGPYKGLYSLVAAVGLVLIVWGFSRYRSAGYIQIWNPPFSIFHPIALVLLWLPWWRSPQPMRRPAGSSRSCAIPCWSRSRLWALSHLLVNGDLGSLLLFGSLLAWAIYDRIAVKRRGDQGAPVVESSVAMM
jgi:uncharacterized membrane protein